MTTQRSEDFVNDFPRLALGEWRVFAVIRGTPAPENHGWGDREARVYRATPKDVPPRTTANWKGYVERWHLKPDGALHLDAIVYDDEKIPPLLANERIEGDFHLVVKSEFEGPRQYIPFVASQIVLDEARWLHEQYVGPSPVKTELRAGKHPDFPRAARLWYEMDF